MKIDVRMRRRRVTIKLILNVADELRAEQENANSCEKNRRTLEFKVDNIICLFVYIFVFIYLFIYFFVYIFVFIFV